VEGKRIAPGFRFSVNVLAQARGHVMAWGICVGRFAFSSPLSFKGDVMRFC
jgi:hypothetical protein